MSDVPCGGPEKLACPRCDRVDEVSTEDADATLSGLITHMGIRHRVYDWQVAATEISKHNEGKS